MFWSNLDLRQALQQLEHWSKLQGDNTKCLARAVGLTAINIICYPSYCHTLQYTPTMTQCSALRLHRAQGVLVLSASLKPEHALSAVAHDWLWAAQVAVEAQMTDLHLEMLAKNLELTTSCLVSNPDPRSTLLSSLEEGLGTRLQLVVPDNSPWQTH